MIKSILTYSAGALALLAMFLLIGCACPPKNADGTKSGPCEYIGPNITGTVGFQGVSVGVTLWGKTLTPTPPPVVPTIPDAVAGIPIGTK